MTTPAPTPAQTPQPAPPAPAPAPTPEPVYTPPATQADLDKIIGQRLNSERARLGGITPEELAQLRQDAAEGKQAKLANGTDMERAVAEATTAAEKAAADRFLPMLARASIEGAAAGRVTGEALTKALEYTDLSKFVTAGQVDAAKVTEFVNSIAPTVVPGASAPRGPVIPGHQTTSTSAPAGSQGLSMAEKRFGKKNQA